MARRSRKSTQSSKTADSSANALKTDEAPKPEDETIEDAEVVSEVGPDGQPVVKAEEKDGTKAEPETDATADKQDKNDNVADTQPAVDEAKAEIADEGKRGTSGEETATPDETPEDQASEDDAEAPEQSVEGEAAPEPKVEDDTSTDSGDASDRENAAKDGEQTSDEPRGAAPPIPDTAAASSGAAAGREASAVPAVVPLVIGGAIAALIGFAVARYMDANEVVEGPTPAENASAIAVQSEELANLDAAVAELSTLDPAADAEAAVAPLRPQLEEIGGRLDALDAALSTLTDEVRTLALRPVATGIEADEFDDALAEFRQRVDDAIANAQSEVAAARDEAARISAEAYDAEQQALVSSAWSQVTAALQSGAPYAGPLATLAEIGGMEVPAALSGPAEDGLPTLSQLQASFPDAARAALDAAIRADTGSEAGDRLFSFLRVQTGMRSLTPREGDDPDAILSRAEAALRGGDLGTVLTELEGLPETGRSEMTGWEDVARVRLEALAAAEALSSSLNTN